MVSKAVDQLFGAYTAIKHEKIETGVLPFDTLAGGGLRIGSCIAIGGGEGCGKSTTYMNIVKNLIKAGKRVAYVDVEKSGAFIEQLESFDLLKYTQLSPDYVPGTVPQLYYVNSIVTYGEFQDFCRRLISNKAEINYEFIILDSVSALAQEKMVNGDCEAAQVAYDALPISKLIKSVRGILYNAGISLFFVAQAASNINGGMYDPTWYVKLTRAIKHTVDLLFVMEKPDYKKYKITEEGTTVLGTTGEVEVGYIAKLWTIKNRVVRSQKIEVPIIYGKGIDNVRYLTGLLFTSGRITSRGEKYKLSLGKTFEGDDLMIIEGWNNLINLVQHNYHKIVDYLKESGQFDLNAGNYLLQEQDEDIEVEYDSDQELPDQEELSEQESVIEQEPVPDVAIHEPSKAEEPAEEQSETVQEPEAQDIVVPSIEELADELQG